MTFEKATRRKAKLRLALTGVSGAGKTLGALYLAYGVAGDWDKIALIDTEHERARFYASRTDLAIPTGEFRWAALEPPYSPDRYIEYARVACDVVGPDGVVIIDSLSHAWTKDGGVMDIKDQIAESPKENGFTAWNKAGKCQSKLIDALMSLDCHTIVTMRSKMDYVVEEDDRGRKAPRKVGLAPVQRDDTEYEFDIVLDVGRSHRATASKDTTFLDAFDGVITPGLGVQLRDWLDNGVAPTRCRECGKIITPTATKSAQDVIDGTTKKMGAPHCMTCYGLWVNENERAKAVSA